MRNIIISVLATLLLLTQVVSAESLSAKRFDPQAKQKADILYNAAYHLYEQQQYYQSIKLFKASYDYRSKSDVAFNIGLIYEKLNKYKNAMRWYQKAFALGDTKGGVNLGLLYEKLNDIPNAILWYKKAINAGDLGAYDNIAILYHDIKKDNLTAAAYYIVTIGKSYSKKEILDFLKNDWKIDEPTLKKAYELQKKLVPDPYTGGIE